MNYPLDTHTFLWFINADPTLSATAQATIETGTNRNATKTSLLFRENMAPKQDVYVWMDR